MAYYKVSDTDLTGIADKIRAKGGTSALMEFPDGYKAAVDAIPTGITPTGTKTINVSANGTTTHDVTNYASAQVIANVPNTYAAGDEGKVVSNGALVAQTSDTVTTNDTYDTTLINALTVNVSGGGGGVGSVVTATADVMYGKDAIKSLFDIDGSAVAGDLLVGQLINKARADFVDFQLCTFANQYNNMNGGWFRLNSGRTGIEWKAGGNTTRGDIAVGDQFEILSPKTY